MIRNFYRALLAISFASLLSACGSEPAAQHEASNYFDNSSHPDAWAGGVRMVPIRTQKGDFNVWVKRVGNNPDLKLLILHGGPAMGHDYLDGLGSILPGAGVEYYMYDQLGAGLSDRPDDDDLWTIDRYVDEVEQVRTAIGATKDNFCLYGQSWGGILAIEYALQHQAELKCLIISNMMASIPAYNEYADRVLKPQLKPEDLKLVEQLEAEGKTDDPRYLGILIPEFYEKHFLRRPMDQWPFGVLHSFDIANEHVYTLMQGPSELGASGRLANWDRFDDLKQITVPTLVIGAKYDTMEPAYMEKMSKELPKGEYAFMPEGSHLALYDDQQNYAKALTDFLKKFD
ncbi:proline iminopeptidase-family hydrolase [Altererythrobacter salegens]|uniref:Proline iminopeptidase-family hydrolase n=1 Tax=Croceibacterium salegens TaxID=1737568 RepID=A0A6I4SRY4_9SPHN|nr:proline iminopeptidase-family hydrolase [Croceibacterium salegens]MXO58319.1 proline iminopeptidase-family hydrolase [Croceibacterium salegens]